MILVCLTLFCCRCAHGAQEQSVEELCTFECKRLKSPAKKLIVLLHGLGGNGTQISSLVRRMADNGLEDWCCIAPNGSKYILYSADSRGWFDWVGVGGERTSLLYFINNLDTDASAASAMEHLPMLRKIIQKKQQELNLTNQDTIIIGFSQGAIMGLYLTLTEPKDASPFLCTISLGGAVVLPSSKSMILSEVHTKTPIYLLSGTDDDVIPISEIENTNNFFIEKGVQCTHYPFSALTHFDLIDNEQVVKKMNAIIQRHAQ